jgi:hypothetical protein
MEQMKYILGSDEWDRLKDQLDNLVNNFSIKVVPGTPGFQI